MLVLSDVESKSRSHILWLCLAAVRRNKN